MGNLQNVLELLQQHTNDWDGSDEPEKIAASRYAVIVERDDDSWVLAADTLQDIALIELNCLIGTEGYDEWVESVYEVATMTDIGYTYRVSVQLTLKDGTTAVAANI